MWIVSKDKKYIFNAERITSFYVTFSGTNVIRCAFDNVSSKPMTLGEYLSAYSAEAIMAQIAAAICRNESVYYMPDDDAAEQMTRIMEQRARASNGKKTVRRGGS